jgi:hypothetical protein
MLERKVAKYIETEASSMSASQTPSEYEKNAHTAIRSKRPWNQ